MPGAFAITPVPPTSKLQLLAPMPELFAAKSGFSAQWQLLFLSKSSLSFVFPGRLATQTAVYTAVQLPLTSKSLLFAPISEFSATTPKLFATESGFLTE